MKKLICAKELEQFSRQGKKVFEIDEDTIITSAARDVAQNNGIEFCVAGHGNYNDSADHKTNSNNMNQGSMAMSNDTMNKEIIYKVLKMMEEKGLIKDSMVNNSDQPYLAEKDPSGLKVVRGNSVKYDEFDTGNPTNNVSYQELINKDESSMSAGFLIIDKSRFNWELTYEELDYVIEGTLSIELNGKTYTAYPGDVLFVPKGSKVVWSSPDKAKVFYTTFPANWADLL